MMKETEKKTGCWPGVLTQKDLDIIINLYFRKEVEKRYGQEVQSFCKTPSFGLATESKSCPREIDQHLLKNIIQETQKKVPLLSSMIMTVGPSSWRTAASISNATTTKLVNMKIVIIPVIFYCSTHWNNSNYVPLLLALYIYSAGARVNAITLLNHFGLLVSYNVLQRKFKDIMGSTIS